MGLFTELNVYFDDKVGVYVVYGVYMNTAYHVKSVRNTMVRAPQSPRASGVSSGNVTCLL